MILFNFALQQSHTLTQAFEYYVNAATDEYKTGRIHF